MPQTVVSHVEYTHRVDRPARKDGLQKYLLYRRHLFAYQQACRVTPTDAPGLDVACGLGYGLAELLKRCPVMFAVDLARKPLEHLPRREDMIPVQAEASSIPLRSGSVGIAVAFQLIEHVPPSVALTIIREMRRVLRPGGYGFLTTPNARWRLLPGQKPWNRFHIKEYHPKEIRDFCKRAGIPEEDIQGVVGTDGAQEIELRRVQQDPLKVWFRVPKRVRRGLNRMFHLRRKTTLDPRACVTSELEQREWFTLSPDYATALDFWITLRGE